VRDTSIGIVGTLTSFGLSEVDILFSALAGLATTIYMVIAVIRALKKK
jgi:hypothetical protein